MIKNLYAVYDSKAVVFSQPFQAPNEHVAARDFARAVNDPQSDLFHSPADFSLVAVGTFNDDTGVLESKPLQTITTASAVKGISA